jgi:hypothetical protein
MKKRLPVIGMRGKTEVGGKKPLWKTQRKQPCSPYLPIQLNGFWGMVDEAPMERGAKLVTRAGP